MEMIHHQTLHPNEVSLSKTPRKAWVLRERTKMKLFLAAINIFILAASPSWSEPARLSLSLSDLTQAALQNSPKLKAAQLQVESAKSSANSAGAAEWPRFGLDGSYRYQAQVPSMRLSPMGPTLTFGDNNNYNVGANLSWTLWDFQSLHNQANSFDRMARSREQILQATERQLVLALRLAYFKTQISLEQVRLLGDSLKLAQAQYADIRNQSQYGKASRLDRLTSHQEVLDFQRQLRQAQAELSNSLRDLFSLAGIQEPADFALPMDFRLQGKMPQGSGELTVWLAIDAVSQSHQALEAGEKQPPDDSVPQIRTYAYLADSARYAGDAVFSQLLPKIAVSARADFEYPNGPILETIQQNTVGVSVSLPLFDWGRIVNDSDSKQKQAKAYLKDLDQARSDLMRDWNKAQDQLRALRFQKSLNQTAVSETEELARLTYGAYQAGGVRFLEVESANVRAIQAKIISLRNDIQILMQLSVLSSLSGQSNQGAKP
jgi:outer membrane protein TolC